MKILVYSFREFEKKYILEANQTFKFDLELTNAHLNPTSAKMAKGFDAVACFAGDSVNGEVIQELKKCGIKLILLRSAGYNHVDLDMAKELGIAVARVPAYSPYAIAEHTVAMIMALNRKIIQANQRVKTHNFSLNGLVGFDMHGKTVGIIGTGKIGEKLAYILNGFGCKLLGYDIEPNEDLINSTNIKYVGLETLMQQSDIISLHVPLMKETHYIINEENLKLVKKGVMLINTSRGGLVDTKAVINLLKSAQIGYFGIDVYEEEEGLFFEDHSDNILQDDVIARLMTFQNVLITSHQAFLTDTALENISEITLQNANHFATNQTNENFLV